MASLGMSGAAAITGIESGRPGRLVRDATRRGVAWVQSRGHSCFLGPSFNKDEFGCQGLVLDLGMVDTDETQGMRAHILQLFEDEQARIDAVTAFSSPFLMRGEAVLLAATGEHGRLFDRGLRRLGLDVDGLKARGQWRIADADEVLASFMRSSTPMRRNS